MNESDKFDYDKPSRETLIGITLTFDDTEPVPQGPVAPPEKAALSSDPATARPRLEDLFGITFTFEDSPADAHPDGLPPQPPTSPSQPGQPNPGS